MFSSIKKKIKAIFKKKSIDVKYKNVKDIYKNESIVKLHVGCGTNYIDGWVNIDNNSDNNILYGI